MDLLFWLAVATLLFFLYLALRLVAERRHSRRLSLQAPASARPSVSVVVPARNEERHIEEALASILRQDYSALEVIVVDDRSTDRTTAILHRMAEVHPSLITLRVDTLPSGWLGKNHALWLGAARARGELLLFTDADVIMEPSTLARAVGLMQDHGLDHLAAGPRVQMPGWLLNAFFGAFMIFFTLYSRPWRVRDPQSSAHIGIGAFNLVKGEVYRAVGGHRAIALRPDDDMRLGRLIKEGGYRQDLAIGSGMLQVEWYASTRELIRGLEKNTFAGLDYRLSLVLLGSICCFAGFIWPYAGLFLAGGGTRLLNLGIVALLSFIYIELADTHDLCRRYTLGLPVAAALFIFILWRSAAVITIRGGMDWRGTRYSLSDLRSGRAAEDWEESDRIRRTDDR